MVFTSMRKFIFSLSLLCFFANHNVAIADDNPFILYTAPINAAALVALYKHCITIENEKCDDKLESCSKSIDEQIIEALAKCFVEKTLCYLTAKDDYDYCCDQEGDPVCPKYCKDRYNDDISICDSIGTKCTQDVFKTKYKEPNLAECKNDYNLCLLQILATCEPLYLDR